MCLFNGFGEDLVYPTPLRAFKKHRLNNAGARKHVEGDSMQSELFLIPSNTHHYHHYNVLSRAEGGMPSHIEFSMILKTKPLLLLERMEIYGRVEWQRGSYYVNQMRTKNQ